MRIIIVDDEKRAIDSLRLKLNRIEGEKEILSFQNPNAALDYLSSHDADVAFLDIEMYDMNGLELAKRAQALHPQLSVIFLTGFSEYALDAFRLHATGYLTKPASVKDIEAELNHIREKALLPPKKRLHVQTFGDFGIFLDGIPMRFNRTKTLELLAFLIDRRGTMLSMPDIASALWEEKPYDRSLASLLRNVISDLRVAFKKAGLVDALCKEHNRIAVNTDAFDCDYYRFLEGDPEAIGAFNGEYMKNYSWAERSLVALTKKDDSADAGDDDDTVNSAPNDATDSTQN